MLFNSWSYAVFLPIVFFAYWLIPARFRWVLLLAASYYFYMSWDARYIVLIVFTTVVSYAAALLIAQVDALGQDEGSGGAVRRRKRRIILVAALVVCLGVLFFFKYFDWLAGSVVAVLNNLAIPLSPITLQLVLPVGISFYTFQTLSYVVDVYKGQLEPERHFGYYATYIAFFPQLVAGPIERAGNIIPQLRAEHRFDAREASLGVQRIAWGLFKKVVVADTLAKGVDVVYGSVTSFEGPILVVATVLFAIQIYCDFSGYSDIAIGSAQLLGIKLMTNFDSPYFSASIKEFWSRWHISLSTWFRDYVYIPLGGSRCSARRRDFNLMATFLLSGLWHGANWTFVIWGALHGVGQVIEKRLNPLLGRFTGKDAHGWRRALAGIVVFAFVCFAWVFFRAENLGDALYVVLHAFAGWGDPAACWAQLCSYSAASGLGWTIIIADVAILTTIDALRTRYALNERLADAPLALRFVLYALIIAAIALLASKGTAAEFIYFQF